MAAGVKQRHPCSLLKQTVLIPANTITSAQRHLIAFFIVAVIITRRYSGENI